MKAIFLVSVGRCGSTWFAKELAASSGYVNIGENRYFWDRVFQVQNADQRRRFFERFIAKKTRGRMEFVDKSTNIYRYINDIPSLGLSYHVVFLKRDFAEMAESKRRLSKAIFLPSRLGQRVVKYWRDYGLLMVVPIVQRWRFCLLPFGYDPGKAISTCQSRKGELAFKGGEEAAFDMAVSNADDPIVIDYNRFSETVGGLRRLGFSDSAIEGILSRFSKRGSPTT